jgi:hypothetical protein
VSVEVAGIIHANRSFKKWSGVMINVIKTYPNNKSVVVWFGTSFTPYPNWVFWSLVAVAVFSFFSLYSNYFHGLTPWIGMYVVGVVAAILVGLRKCVFVSYKDPSACLVCLSFFGVKLRSRIYDLNTLKTEVKTIQSGYLIVLDDKKILYTNSLKLAQQVNSKLTYLIQEFIC